MSKAPKDAPNQNPWMPPQYDVADAAAMRAIWLGTATPDQQRRGLEWIINVASCAYDMSFRPGGPEGDRDTNFAEGKRFVGNQVVKLINLNTAKLAGAKEGGEHG